MADRPTEVDFKDPRWSYLLGVVHGDGHVAPRSISIAVSYKEPGYVGVLTELFGDLGFSPKLYRARTTYKVEVHSRALAQQLALTKSAGVWTIPSDVCPAAYFAGVIDTDGHLTKAPQRQVVICVKRSGNLERLVLCLSRVGLRCNPVRPRIARYCGQPYEVEETRWSGADQIEWIAGRCVLRHQRKADRLSGMMTEILASRAQTPPWVQIAGWLSECPRDADEIGARFGLTKRQVDSALDQIRAKTDLEIIPPPRVLTKYRVKVPVNIDSLAPDAAQPREVAHA